MKTYSADTTLRLSVEELALGLGIHGEPAISKLLLISTFGDISPQDEQGRLLAAGHSLMARGFLTLSSGQPQLTHELLVLLERMSNYKFAIRYDRKMGSDETTRIFFVGQEKILEQSIEQGVVYSFTEIEERDSIIRQGISMFQIKESVNTFFDSVSIQAEVLEQARQSIAQPLEVITNLLVQNAVPIQLARALAQSLKNEFARGTVMRVEQQKGKLISEEGFLILVSPSNAWLFPVSVVDGIKYVRILIATTSVFAQQTKTLMHSKV